MDAHKLEDGHVGIVLSQDEADVLEAVLLKTRLSGASSAKPDSPAYQVVHELWAKLNAWRKLRVGDGLPEVVFDVEGLDLVLKEAKHKHTLITRS